MSWSLSNSLTHDTRGPGFILLKPAFTLSRLQPPRLSFHCFQYKTHIPASGHCAFPPGFPLPRMLSPMSSHGWLHSYIAKRRRLFWPCCVSTTTFPYHSWAPLWGFIFFIAFTAIQYYLFVVHCLSLPTEGKLYNRMLSVRMFNPALAAPGTQ